MTQGVAATALADLAVVWEVVEAGGGAVDGGGVYTAPGTTGTFHVRVSSHADPGVQATATVTVATVQPGTLQVWVARSMERVFRADAPGATSEARLYAARGEYEPFQVAVRAPGSGLKGVNVTASDLVSSSGARITAANLALFRERYVTISTSTYAPSTGNRPGPPGSYPDGLIPFVTSAGPNPSAAPFAVAPGVNEPVWIDLFVPRDATPGDYTGTVTITAAEGQASVPVRLTVWDFELPLRPSQPSAFGLHGARNTDKRYQAFLAEHKLAAQYTQAANAPDLQSRFGLTISQLPFWSNRSGCTMDPAPTVSAFSSAVAAYPSTLDLYTYIADEIDGWPCVFPTVIAWARNLHQTRAKALVTVPPRPELLDDGTGRSAVDIWVMLPKQFNVTDPSYLTVRSRGNEIWSYTALVQDRYSPKWAIDFAPINYRIMPGFINQSLDVTGILYWGVDIWSSDPWNNVMWPSSCGPTPPAGSLCYAGEGMLVYPGESVGVSGPVASMRLKWIREGIEDYEYVQILKNIGRGTFALGLARTVGADWANWTKDPAALENVRLQLGQELNRLRGGL